MSGFSLPKLFAPFYTFTRIAVIQHLCFLNNTELGAAYLEEHVGELQLRSIPSTVLHSGKVLST